MLSKADRIFHKIMTNYRKGHILNILDSFDSEHLDVNRNTPLDFHMRRYYLKNKTVTNIDREFINDQVYNLIRYRGLLDFLGRSPLTWETRFDAFYNTNFEKQLQNVNLPPHLRVSFPKFLFELMSNTFSPEKAFDYCKVMNERAPLTVRANLLKASREDLYNIFKKKNFNVRKTENSPYGITFLSHPKVNFFAMDEFKQGLFEVQDEGSQLVSLRVDCKVKY
jgi:16S rRNA (cytosine967-C5)-methyltransferase